MTTQDSGGTWRRETAGRPGQQGRCCFPGRLTWNSRARRPRVETPRRYINVHFAEGPRGLAPGAQSGAAKTRSISVTVPNCGLCSGEGRRGLALAERQPGSASARPAPHWSSRGRLSSETLATAGSNSGDSGGTLSAQGTTCLLTK